MRCWGELVMSLRNPYHLLMFHCSLISSGRVKPVIYTKVYSLENLADGLQALEQRKTWGKVAVRVRDDKTKAKL